MTPSMIRTGVDLYVEEGGEPGPTLVLLHGLGANGDVWKPILPLLQQRWRGRWLIPDFRGHGRSSHRGPYSYAGHAADVAALLEQDEEVVVVGHSMGGAAGLVLASGWFGINVRAVLAFGIKIRWTADEITKLKQLAQAPVRWFDNESQAVDRYLKVSGLVGLVEPSAPEALSGIRQENGRFRLAADPKSNAAVGPTVESLVAAARAPVRLAAGQNDSMVTFADMTAFDRHAVIFDRLGHNAHVENPEVVWKFVEDAVDRHPARN
jgi:pimeloyl-ACP methyl ester carboxylesterase